MSTAEQRVAVVVGGASGIGWAVAQGLADEGCCVTVAERNGDCAAACADELGEGHAAATVDVTDESAVAAVFERIGPLDIVVNSAGFIGYGRITDLPTEQFREVVNVCLNGSFIVAKHAGRYLRTGINRILERRLGRSRDGRRLQRQSGFDYAHPGCGVGVCATRDPGQCRVTGLRSHSDDPNW